MILTLPLCGVIKQLWPKSTITFLGKAYTAPIIKSCVHVDHFLDVQDALEASTAPHAYDVCLHVFPQKEVAHKVKSWGIPLRVGTSHRWWHWLTCNVRPSFSRKGSDKHEAVLNLELLKPVLAQLGSGLAALEPYENMVALGELFGFVPSDGAVEAVAHLPKDAVVLHPKSAGSAREWPLSQYHALAQRLMQAGYTVAVTGTAKEGERMQNELPDFLSSGVVNLCGALQLDELIAYLSTSRAVVACSTGPLHIASALGKPVVGLYPPIKPMHPGRWAPLGKHARVLVNGKECSDCRKGGSCSCMVNLHIQEVLTLLSTAL